MARRRRVVGFVGVVLVDCRRRRVAGFVGVGLLTPMSISGSTFGAALLLRRDLAARRRRRLLREELTDVDNAFVRTLDFAICFWSKDKLSR